MGVKETPISDTADTADEDEENGEQSEETPPEDSKQEEAPEEKPKRAKAKPEAKKKEAKPKPEKKAEAKPEKKAEAKPEKKAEAKPKKKTEEKPKPAEQPEEPEEMAKPAKRKAKKETVDIKQKTMCSICKSEPISTDALLYTHSCKKEALAKRKTAPLYDEEPNAHCHGNATGESVSRGNPVAASVGSLSQAAPPSYREILARQQQEMRRQKAARIVNPIRALFFGYAL